MTTIRSHKAAAVLSLFVLFAAGFLFTACQHRKEAGAGGLSGRYELASVDGKALPASVSHHGSALQVRSGWFRFEADGNCSTETVFVPPSGKEVKREVSATYTQNGSKVAMKWKGAGQTTGMIEGGTFTMNNEGMIFVYRK